MELKSSSLAARSVSEPALRTRERLLDAAERLFAAGGYRATSVRDITAEARCNLAAVTYHFGGKRSLYGEVFRRRMKTLREQRIRSVNRALVEAGDRADLEMILRSFTTAFLEPHLDESRGRLLMQLFSRELLEPHLQPDTLQREMVEPVETALIDAIRAVGVRLNDRSARRCVESIVGQLVHTVRMRGLVQTTRGRNREDSSFSRIVDHIVRYSAAGIRSYSGGT